MNSTEKRGEEPKKITGLIGMKFGCLQVVDDGTEYLQVISARIASVEEEKLAFIAAVKEKRLVRKDRYGWNGEVVISTPAYVYTPKTFEVLHYDCVTLKEFDAEILKLLKKKKVKRYKCVCKKCGKIRYYSEETLQSKPSFCYRPIYCSSRFTYATCQKEEKYKDNESVCLQNSRDALVPSKEYCDSWNEKRKKELIKQEEKDAKIIAAVPRKFAQNYDKNFVGLRYESYEVIECIDDAYEDAPVSYYNERHQKKYRDITIHKRYRCKCYLCGKEKMVNCDQFGIYPPTQYDYQAYNGYWSKIYCDCHQISSFQWIVNDILLKHNVEYRVEVSVDGLYGVDNKTPLRFDFAVYRGGALLAFIECQGEQHYRSVEEFGGEHSFVNQQRNDEAKRRYAQEKNIELVEISYKDKKYEKVESILKFKNII